MLNSQKTLKLTKYKALRGPMRDVKKKALLLDCINELNEVCKDRTIKVVNQRKTT